MTMHEPNQRIADLHKVLEVSRSMVAAADLDSLLRVIIERSMELLNAERATLFLYDAEANELVSRIAAGVGELRVPADRGISGATISSGRTINVPDVYADRRFNPEVDRSTGFRTCNLLSVPLFGHDGRLVGVLQVINKRSGAFEDYDVTLAETLGAQAGVAIQREDLIAHFVQKQQMERAMKIARDIQRGLLPKAAPRLEGFDIAGFSLPADQTGGDTYDFLALPDGRWMISVADASGHGIGSALVIAETRAMLRAVALGALPQYNAAGRGLQTQSIAFGASTPLRGGEASGPPAAVYCGGERSPNAITPVWSLDPSDVLRTVNDLLIPDLGEERFVTCFCGLLIPEDSARDPRRNRPRRGALLTYASAGHGPLIFYERRSDRFRELPATALPLGVEASKPVAAGDVQSPQATRGPRRNRPRRGAIRRLSPGDFVAVCTDGFMDTANSSGEEFGSSRVVEVLRRNCKLSAEGMIQALHAAVSEFAAGAPQIDDLTAVVIRKL